MSFCDQPVVSSSYANLVRSTHFGIQYVHAAEVRTMTKIWKYLFSYDSPQRNDQTNGQILRFPHISKYLSFLFALFWSVDMPDIWFWVSGWVLILVTVTGNGLVIYFIRTKPGRQILLHSRPHPCWSLFQSQPRLLVLLQHQSLRHDGRPLPCHHKAFAVHVLRDERNCLGDDYYGLEWPISILLFAFHTIRHNLTFTMFVEVSRMLIFQILLLVIFVAATSHLLRIAWKVNRQTRELISQVRHNHAMNTSGQNIQPPAVFRVQHGSSTVLIIWVMTAFNITYLGGNYHCLCFLTNLCPFTGTLRYMVYLVLIANTAANPVLYSFFKSDIQKELFKLISR